MCFTAEDDIEIFKPWLLPKRCAVKLSCLLSIYKHAELASWADDSSNKKTMGCHGLMLTTILPLTNAYGDQSHHKSRDRAFRAAQFPSSFKLLVLKSQELNLSMGHPSPLFLVTCDRLFFALHFGKQRVCCILIWC